MSLPLQMGLNRHLQFVLPYIVHCGNSDTIAHQASHRTFSAVRHPLPAAGCFVLGGLCSPKECNGHVVMLRRR